MYIHTYEVISSLQDTFSRSSVIMTEDKLMKVDSAWQAIAGWKSKIPLPKCPKAISNEISPRCAMQEISSEEGPS